MLCKKLFTMFLVCLMFTALATFGSCEEISPPSDAKIMDLSTVSGEELAGISKDPSAAGKMIFYAPKDYELTVNLAISGTVASLQDNEKPVKIKFHIPVYVYFPSCGDPVFSTDGKTWETGDKLFSGSISCGFAGDKEKNDGKITSNFSFELNLRSEGNN
ncbi:MAG: hypothetical protein ABRQ38_05520 [Candidatus Eremiobacterota bacterium]